MSCPCALGIATPIVISLGIDKAARQGVLIKGGQYLEKLSSIDTIVFDKTGTLTVGKPQVTDIIPNTGYTAAASAEIKSEHPIAQAIVRRASEQSIPTLQVSEFNSLTGHGVIASYFEKKIFVGNIGITKREKRSNEDSNSNNGNRTNSKITATIPKSLLSKISDLESDGKTVVTVLVGEATKFYML